MLLRWEADFCVPSALFRCGRGWIRVGGWMGTFVRADLWADFFLLSATFIYSFIKIQREVTG